MTAKYFIGTSGWVYQHWKGRFYPQKLAQSKWLGYYTEHFPTVELNNSFYHLPSEKAFHNWRQSTPSDFTFAVKVSRFITHIKRLKDCGEPLETFLGRARLLEDKLGPLLYQLPPNMHRDDQRLETFLALLPQSFRHVIEFRHESWLDEGVFQLLSRYNVGFCIMDMSGMTCPVTATANFAYIRFHGSTGVYWGCYSDEQLKEWAGKIAELGKRTEAIYIYFNNDANAWAVQNAKTLGRMLIGDLDRTH